MIANTNPFTTRHIQPGAMPFLSNLSATDWVARLQTMHWRGEIVGPHGSGKTTLLYHVKPQLAAGRRLTWFTVRPGMRRVPLPRQLRTTDQIIVDGFDRLGLAQRTWVRWRTRRAGCGLLITAHRSHGLPRLHLTQPDRAVWRQIVKRLDPERRLPKTRVDACYERHQPNLREALFALYDLYEDSSALETRGG